MFIQTYRKTKSKFDAVWDIKRHCIYIILPKNRKDNIYPFLVVLKSPFMLSLECLHIQICKGLWLFDALSTNFSSSLKLESFIHTHRLFDTLLWEFHLQAVKWYNYQVLPQNYGNHVPSLYTKNSAHWIKGLLSKWKKNLDSFMESQI